jgi:amino acid adenylation domain-containing protein
MGEPLVFEIPEEIYQRLGKLSDARDAPLSTALATASAVLLHKYSCEGTLGIRTTNPGRSESSVGLLPVNLVILDRAPDDPSFAGMLTRARQILPNRPEGPEVEILLPPGFQNEFQHERKGQPLRLSFRIEHGSLTGILDAHLPRLAEHLQSLLRGVTAAPTAPISTINILGDQETRQILIEWNRTDRGYAQSPVPELVEQQVQRTPHAVALMQADRKLTYSQLDERANRLANYLRKRSVESEMPVGLCLEQSLEAVVAVLAILKAGGAYVPLDPSYPEHRLEEIAADSRLAVAVTSARFRHRIPAGIEAVCVDRDSAPIAEESSITPMRDITPDSAAYILYTSASTGKPKGVVGIHRSITNGLHSVAYRPDEVCCLNTFLSYGFSMANLFLPLISGVPVVVLSDEQIRDSNQMMSVLEKEGVTRIVLVPSVLKQILDPNFAASTRLSKITTIGVAGAKLTPSHFRRLTEAMPQAKLQNRYASTEIGTVAATYEVTDESLAGGQEIPIGRPVANTRIYILDRHMHPVPVGVAGEICVGAAHLARGYLNQPDLTEQRFIPDPFSPDPGRRLYRTGDLGRFKSNGEIEFVGRVDHQVKINGFRIDLLEVEQALASHLGVSEAVTAVREIGDGQRLVAYVVAKPIGTPNASQLRRYLQDRLAAHMIPARFIFLKDLPKLRSGSVAREALPAPEPVRPRLEIDYRPPGTPLESAIVQMWSDVLGLDRIGIHDPFRDLGGDSMAAAEVALRLGQRFGIEITPEELLARSTIAELALYLSCPRATAAGV